MDLETTFQKKLTTAMVAAMLRETAVTLEKAGDINNSILKALIERLTLEGYINCSIFPELISSLSNNHKQAMSGS